MLVESHVKSHHSNIKSITKIEFEIRQEELLLDSKHVILQFFPSWNPTEIKTVQCTNGITNKLVKATHFDETILIRTYGKGSGLLIDRKQELSVIIIIINSYRI